MNNTRKLLKKKENVLLKKFTKCRRKKCLKHIKKRNSISKSFDKEQDIKCPQKSSKAFYDCSSKFYEGSDLQKLSEEVVKCSDKKCVSHKKKLNEFRKKIYRG